MNVSKDIVCNSNSSMLDAIKEMNAKKNPIAAIVNNENVLIGIVTDGDIRRAYEKDVDLNSEIINFANTSPNVFRLNEFPLNSNDIIIAKKHIATPVVDEKFIFQYFYYLKEEKTSTIYDNPVFIMAGGFGKRLKPYTNFCPKPMLTINNKPLIQHIIENINSAGFNNIHLILHHMPKVFKNYFKNKTFLGKAIQIHVEQKPLGTIGGLYKFKNKIDKDFFVFNGDNIVNANWKNIMDNHINNKNMVSVCSANYSVQIPYGVVELNDDKNIKKITEKPLYNWKTICSAYCFSPIVLKDIKENEFQDMPAFISKMIKNGHKVGVEDVYSFQRIEDLIEQNKKNWIN